MHNKTTNIQRGRPWLMPQTAAADTYVDRKENYTVSLGGTNIVYFSAAVYDQEGYDCWVTDGNLKVSVDGGAEYTVFHWVSTADISGDATGLSCYFSTPTEGFFDITLGNSRSTSRLTKENAGWRTLQRNSDGNTFSFSAEWVVPYNLLGKTLKFTWDVERDGNGRYKEKVSGLNTATIKMPEASAKMTPFVSPAMLNGNNPSKLEVPWYIPAEDLVKASYEYDDGYGQHHSVEIKDMKNGTIMLDANVPHRNFCLMVSYNEKGDKGTYLIENQKSQVQNISMIHAPTGLTLTPSYGNNAKVELRWSVPYIEDTDLTPTDFFEIQRSLTGREEDFVTIFEQFYAKTDKKAVYSYTDSTLVEATTFKDCIFAGTINGVGGNRPNMGGFWGWSSSGNPVLVNCLEKGTYTNVSSMHPMGLQYNTGSITDCYYLNAPYGSPDHGCTVRGALPVSVTVSDGDIYKPVTVVDGKTYYMLCTISGVNKNYQYTGSDITVIVPTVTAIDGTVLTEGTDYTCDDYIYEAGCQSAIDHKINVETVTFAPGKQFVIKGTNTIATPENMAGVTIVPYFTLKGKGTEEEPYTIGSTEEWNDFAGYVNNGYNFSGRHVKLTADSISATTPVGTVLDGSPVKPFSGTFDGDGKTLFATISDTEGAGTSLFRNISGATIKNVLVAGTVTGGMNAAAIVGFANGKGNSLTNCAATATVSGGSHIGGLVGNAQDSDVSITGCVYAGLMTGGDTAKGAILGWAEEGGTKSVTDCLYLMVDGQDHTHLDLVKANGNVTVTNCYKTTLAEYQQQQEQNGRETRSPRSLRTDDMPTDDDYDITDLEAYGIWANVYGVKPSYLGQLVTDYGFLKVYEGGLEYDDMYYVACISLAHNADNSAVISLATEYIVDVSLTGRTLSKDGTWQTLCLPFDLGDPDATAYHWFDGTPLEGASVKALGDSEGCQTGFDAATGTLTLDFVDADRIEAGRPYIVMWESGDDMADPIFRGVTITADAPASRMTVSKDGNVHFIGTYSPMSLEAYNHTHLYIDPLHSPSADDDYLNSCRAGFFINLGGAAAPSSIILSIDIATDIRTVADEQPAADDSWYTLDGRKLRSQPTQKGVYVNNGKKVIIK